VGVHLHIEEPTVTFIALRVGLLCSDFGSRNSTLTQRFLKGRNTDSNLRWRIAVFAKLDPTFHPLARVLKEEPANLRFCQDLRKKVEATTKVSGVGFAWSFSSVFI
jgi:hypothetical protein